MGDDEEEKKKEALAKKKAYAQISDEKAKMMTGRDLIRKLEKANLKRRERSEMS